MYNYVNEEAFFAWYEEKTGRKANRALLKELAQQYMSSRKEEFVLSPDAALSGREERYPFRFEAIGCCGACTMYFYL